MRHQKIWAFVLSILLLFLPQAGRGESTVWRYSFAAGEMLEGEGMDAVREALDAIQVELASEQQADRQMGQAVLLSYGKPVFTLRAAAAGGDSFGLYCSLLGNCTLQCRQDQVDTFLLTLVEMLGERSLLKEDSLAQAKVLAGKTGDLILKAVRAQEEGALSAGLDLNTVLQQLRSRATAVETAELDGTAEECPGARWRQDWLLSEEDLNLLASSALEKVRKIPFLGTALEEGRIRIGSQTVTEPFLREVIRSAEGDITLTVYLDGEERVLRMCLRMPGAFRQIPDPVFSRMQGLEFLVEREENAGTQVSRTVLRPVGLEGTLLTLRMEKSAGEGIPPLPDKKVYQVGEMTGSQLWDLIQSLGLVIAGNALNLIMELPRIVFDTMIDRLF